MKCTYCGNTSGRRDTWGGCISCGGRDFITDKLPIHHAIPNGWMTVGEVRQEWMGNSGGFSHRDDRYAPATCPPPKREESIKDAIRRSLGIV